MNHEELEKKLMEMLLSGDDIVLEELRIQYNNSVVESREFTGVGFFTNFNIIPGILPLANSKNFVFGDINATIEGTKNSLGFILFVRDGYISMLEGYTYGSDKWPDNYSNLVISYFGPEGKRDLQKLREKWS